MNKSEKKRGECYDKYIALKKYGFSVNYFVNELNALGLRRKTNSPYTASTVVYTVNGYQADENVEKIINEIYKEKFPN